MINISVFFMTLTDWQIIDTQIRNLSPIYQREQFCEEASQKKISSYVPNIALKSPIEVATAGFESATVLVGAI